FNWEAEQLPSGADAINPTSKDISFTLKYKAAPAPKPNKPAEPSKPVKPADPAKPNKPVVPVKDSKIAPKTGDQTQLPIYASILLGALVIGTVAFGRKRKTDR
ncbi:LPXTG cell wall anchor domain protein, partial [Shuttleworthella sp. MSX8B]|uniref:LPXTG cell wall anchor domain-containing protein n=1 Tax=Shuttleworthella sp. MSX8B TaxID=936574 RepID=UPI000445DAC6